MERIILEVDESVARKWQKASQIKRRKVAAFINRLLSLDDEALPDDDTANGYARPSEKQLLKLWKQNQKDLPAYKDALDEIRKEAAANGLTPEKLGELMEWDAETMKNLFG